MSESEGAAVPELDIGVFRPDRPGVRKVLGDLEAEIMESIWSRAEPAGTTVREVFEQLYARRRIAYTTVMTTMARLARKQLLRVQKQDQAYLYYPNFTEGEFISRFVARILDDLLVSFGDPGTGGTKIDPATRARIRQVRDEIARRRESEEGE